MKKNSILLFLSFLLITCAVGQGFEQTDTLSFIFAGDIMGHDSQIFAASVSDSAGYDYNRVFEKVAPVFSSADFVIANLEVTLAGKPYKGYPRFSSPDELAAACKKSGINVLVTANNHSCDRGREGIIRTIDVLDSLQISHTGTFKNQDERDRNNLLIINKNNMKAGLLNYTYGTNGLPAPSPVVVNRIDTLQMERDIKRCKTEGLDQIIVVIHWGSEYQLHPNQQQQELAKFLFQKGVDIIIGSHPHVLQRMEYYPEDENGKERFVAYSLGNFVSNQRTRKRDGGAMVRIKLAKTGKKTVISGCGYYLTWVNKPETKQGKNFEIIPCAAYEDNHFAGVAETEKLKLFINDSRTLLQKENVNVEEIRKVESLLVFSQQ